MTKVGVIGATGMAGSAIFKEAEDRGHEVTALIRNEDKAQRLLGQNINYIAKDVFHLTKEELEEFDVIINAFATAPDQAYLLVDLTTKLVAMFREDEDTHLFFILGAGSLLDENDELFVKTIEQAPNSEEFISVPKNQLKQLNFLNDVDNVDWVGVSPGETFEEGEATSAKLGQDHLLRDDDGTSHTSTGTMANVILDEIENPAHSKERFTAINA